MSDYDIGYGKPPKQSQWKKGQSGNLKGRSRGTSKESEAMPNISKLEKMILEEGRRRLPIVDNGRRRQVTVAQLVVRRLLASGVQGGVGAAKLAMSLLGEAETSAHRAAERHRRAHPDLTLITPETARKAYFEMLGIGVDD